MATYDKTPRVFQPGDRVKCIVDRLDVNGLTAVVVRKADEFKGDPVYEVKWEQHRDKLFYSWALELERGPW